MASAFTADIARTIRHSVKRFVCILAICALGVTMACGLRASCVDLRTSVDNFYDEQNFYDLYVQSTLGLGSADVEALGEVEGVAQVEGSWRESTYTSANNVRASVEVKALCSSGINTPYVISGTLPTKQGEIAVTEEYLDDCGASLGSTVTLEAASSSDDEIFERTTYTITAVIIDPDELTNPNGSITMRASASCEYSFYVHESAVSSAVDEDTYTIAYLTVSGASSLLCFSDEYTKLVSDVQSRVEAIASQREEARTEEIRTDALATIDEEESKANRELANAEDELNEAQAELDAGAAELESGAAELESGAAELTTAQAELDEQAATVTTGLAQVAEGRSDVESGLEQVAAGIAQLESGLEQVESAQAEVAAGLEQVAAGIEQTNAECDAQAQAITAALESGQQTEEEAQTALAAVEEARTSALAELAANQAELEASQTELATQQQELESQLTALKASQAELETTLATLDEQEAQLIAAKQQIAAGQATLDASAAELATGLAELKAGWAELDAGQAEIDEAWATLEDERANAKAELDSAREEVYDIETATWYVQNRSANASYASVESDANSIESIGFVFPVVFIVIAVLIGLTTITRMVEEERGLIGTYKSLGYSNKLIRRKYVLYALAACVIGGVVGLAGGFIALPAFISTVFSSMYILVSFPFTFDMLYGIGSIIFFVVGIAGAAWLACRKELKEVPAALMRPKAPASGSRVILERITPLWRRLSFLNKVTARNLLRYKKRFFMTVFGIAGCMALLICGFAVSDSVHALSEKQYDELYHYDILAIVSADEYETEQAALQDADEISSALSITVDTVTLESKTDEENLQLFVIPDDAAIETYVTLRDGANTISLTNEGLFLTRNAADLLDVTWGSSLTIQTSGLNQASVEVACVVDNYLGNAVYLTESAYETLFGEAPERNGFYINVNGDAANASALADTLSENDNYLSISETQETREDFSRSFQLINTVVVIIVILAAALAFVVLFTLSNTNISERIRELATIKVLGFRRKEVNHYVNKETILLTVLGVIVGIPVGYAFSHSLTYVLMLPSIYFAVTIDPTSYLYAAGLTLIFAFIVSLLSNKTLQNINMIEALKSVE